MKKEGDILRCDGCGKELEHEEHAPDRHVVTLEGDVVCMPCFRKRRATHD